MRFPRTRKMDGVRTVHAYRALFRGEKVLTHLSTMGMTHVAPGVQVRVMA